MQQYWAGDPDAYDFVGVPQLAKAFQESGIGSEMDHDAPDLEKGRTPKQKAGSKEEDSRETGGKEGPVPDAQKRNALDPLVHDKYVHCILCCFVFSFCNCVFDVFCFCIHCSGLYQETMYAHCFCFFPFLCYGDLMCLLLHIRKLLGASSQARYEGRVCLRSCFCLCVYLCTECWELC